MQALYRRHGVRFQNGSICHALHAQDADILSDQFRQDDFLKAVEVSVHNVEWHLHCIEPESMLRRAFEHIRVDAWILMAGKADVAEFSGLTSLLQCGICPLLVKNPVRIFVAEYLMVLDEVNAIDAESAQRFVELSGRLLF